MDKGVVELMKLHEELANIRYGPEDRSWPVPSLGLMLRASAQPGAETVTESDQAVLKDNSYSKMRRSNPP